MDKAEFINFLKKNQVFSIIIATLLSGGVADLTDSIINNMILPFLEKSVFLMDIDNNGVPDQKQLENITVTFLNTRFYVGKVLMSIVKFIIVVYLVYVIAKLIESKI